MKDIYAVLDIGSTSIKLICAEMTNSSTNILFSKKVPSHGITRGLIKDMDSVVESIKEVVNAAQKALDTTINAVGLVIPSIYAKVYMGDGITKVNSQSDKITIDDVLRTLKLSRRFDMSKDEEVVSTIPVRYHTDTRVMEKIPLNMKSASLKVESMIITTRKKILYSYIIAAEQAGLDILDISIDAYASSKEAFDAVYLQEGAILIDIGYRYSTIAFYEGGYLKYLTQAPVGGYYLTKAISVAWKIDPVLAEQYKIKYGTCDPEMNDEDIIHTTRIENVDRHFTQKDLKDILTLAVNDMMSMIKSKIDVINDGRNYETVIVGGGGELPYLDRIATEVLGSPARCYRPETIGARDMAYVPALGMLYFLNDRKELIGEDRTSLTIDDNSSTMNLRIKGLTKAKSDENHKGRLKRLVDSIFSED